MFGILQPSKMFFSLSQDVKRKWGADSAPRHKHQCKHPASPYLVFRLYAARASAALAACRSPCVSAPSWPSRRATAAAKRDSPATSE